jgi:hypothetical protein
MRQWLLSTMKTAKLVLESEENCVEKEMSRCFLSRRELFLGLFVLSPWPLIVVDALFPIMISRTPIPITKRIHLPKESHIPGICQHTRNSISNVGRLSFVDYRWKGIVPQPSHRSNRDLPSFMVPFER